MQSTEIAASSYFRHAAMIANKKKQRLARCSMTCAISKGRLVPLESGKKSKIHNIFRYPPPNLANHIQSSLFKSSSLIGTIIWNFSDANIILSTCRRKMTDFSDTSATCFSTEWPLVALQEHLDKTPENSPTFRKIVHTCATSKFGAVQKLEHQVKKRKNQRCKNVHIIL